jgi:hypothetical protein
MVENQETAGTPSGNDGDAGDSQTTGTPQTDDRNAPDSNIAKLNLEWKLKAERANELERRIAEYEAREQSPAAQQPQGDDRITQLRAAAQEFERKGDPIAALQLIQDARIEELARDTQFALQIRDLPLEERQEVYNHFQKNRHRLGDPAAARSELREKRFEDENKRLREELTKASRRPDPDVVRTEARDVPASEHKKRTMTEREFDNQIAALHHASRHKEKMAMQIALRNGDIELSQ